MVYERSTNANATLHSSLHYGRQLRIWSRKIPPLFAGSTGCGNGKDGSLEKGPIFLLMTKKRDFPRRMADFLRYAQFLTAIPPGSPVPPPAAWNRDCRRDRVGLRRRPAVSAAGRGRGSRRAAPAAGIGADQAPDVFDPVPPTRRPRRRRRTAAGRDECFKGSGRHMGGRGGSCPIGRHIHLPGRRGWRILVPTAGG